MILQRLVELYDRLAADPAAADALPKPGYSLQKCSFCVVLNPDGSLNTFQSLLDTGKKKPVPRMLLLPGQGKPPGIGINPCFLWDNSGYMLGYKPDDPDPARSRKSFEAFRERHLSLESEIAFPSFAAVCTFLKQWSPEKAPEHPELNDIVSGFGVFRLAGETRFVHDDPAVVSYWAGQEGGDGDAARRGFCLVTGAEAAIARLHEPKIKGVVGTQSAGALLVSFNDKAYESLGKEQGDNAPVSSAAAFRYTNALNYLLNRSDRRLGLGDATVVFWAERPTELEDVAGGLFGDWAPPADDAPAEDKRRAEQVRLFLSRLRAGHAGEDALGGTDDRVGFFVLGLSPNASRISIRLWEQSTVGDMKHRLAQHAADTSIAFDDEVTSLTVRRMVNATARVIGDKLDYDTVSPRLSGDIVRALLRGSAYPDQLLSAILARMGADATVDEARAGAIKAYLIRKGYPDMDPYLNKLHNSPAYHCGRLLATVAFAQERSLKTINAGVIRRTLGAVMTAPGLHLGRLERAAEVGHIPKLDGSLPEFVRDELKFINTALRDDLPRTLDLHGQGLFMLGFYQQQHYLEVNGAQVAAHKRYRTDQGEWVRSKGERRVANLLAKNNIKYVYEPRAILTTGSERWPDFVVFGAERYQTVFIEYLGVDGSEEYDRRWEQKLAAYAEYGAPETGGSKGTLVVLDARKTQLDDVEILQLLSAALGLRGINHGTKTEGASE